jgi:hypothetical protein|nr:MAG TPA: DNA directed RNA polymerase subunit [Caudoviricetes sp.]
METLENLELIRRAKTGDLRATESIIEKYLNAVRKINHKWGNSEDGFQEGILGIYSAIRLYDQTKNVKFLSFVYFHIESRIRKFVNREKYKLPLDYIEKMKQGKKEKVSFTELENYELFQEDKEFKSLENKIAVEKLLNCCTKKEKFIIEKIFLEDYTLEMVANILKCSKQYVGKIKLQALDKMRKSV